MADEKVVQLAPGIDVTNVLVIILYLVLIVAAAYFLTKYVARHSLRKGVRPKAGAGSGGSKKKEYWHMVSIADRIAVDRDKTIIVVEFQGKYYLLGTTAQGFEQIDKVDIPETCETPEESPEEETETGVAAAVEGGVPDTFWNRFKKCFSIVLKSYLPGRANKKDDASFSEQLKEKVSKEDHKQGKDQ